MAPALLFITGVLAGIIAGLILSRYVFTYRGTEGGGDIRLLEQRLAKADQGLEKFTQELEAQRLDAQQARESSIATRTQLEAATRERDESKQRLSQVERLLEAVRSEKELMSPRLAEAQEQLRSQQEQSKTQLEGIERERDDLKQRFTYCETALEKLRQEKESLSKKTAEVEEQLRSQQEQASTQTEALQQERDNLKTRLLRAEGSSEEYRSEKETLSKRLAEAEEQLRSQQEQASTQTEALQQERDSLKARLLKAESSSEAYRCEKEALSQRLAEAQEQLRSQQEQVQFLEKARTDLVTQFRSVSGQMLDGSREALLKSTKETVSEPFAKQMEQLRQQVEALQKDSTEKLGVLAQTTIDLRQRSEDVQGAAKQLVSALRSPNVKGRWGEVNLRRILEYVGLISYCDFNEQVHIGTDDGAYRPDCVITVPGSRRLIVDSKAPIESYLDALQTTDDKEREQALTEHVKKVRSHIDLLSRKNYAEKLSSLGQLVDGVVLFIPVEGALSMALERDPQLLEYAFSKNIILTFPTSLLAILKGLSMTIQQAEIAQNIEEIRSNAIELYKRFSLFTDKFSSVGSNLSRLNKSFNEAVGSFERRLLPQGRRFAEMAGQSTEFKTIETVDESVREISGQ
jgi:DNA recombination protein RmuC